MNSVTAAVPSSGVKARGKRAPKPWRDMSPMAHLDFNDDEANRCVLAMVEHLAGIHDPREVWLFGSRARGDHTPDSDADLLLVMDRVDSARHAIEMAIEMAMDVREFPLPDDIAVASASAMDAGAADGWGLVGIAMHDGAKLVYRRGRGVVA